MSNRGIITKGSFIVGATYSADLAARAEAQSNRRSVARGEFLTGGPAGEVITKRAPLPNDLAEFEAAAAEADRLAATGVDEIKQRLAKAQAMLDQLRAAARRR